MYELNNLVRAALEVTFTDEYWVQAELSEVRQAYNGHCYVEFIQKDRDGQNLIAKARGTIWNSTYRLLKPYFERETGQEFVAGLNVLVRVSVSFHELYGYSLQVTDIDPTYTLGDLARRRKDILKQLSDDGILNDNKELPLPILPNRVAVISSSTAAESSHGNEPHWQNLPDESVLSGLPGSSATKSHYAPRCGNTNPPAGPDFLLCHLPPDDRTIPDG